MSSQATRDKNFNKIDFLRSHSSILHFYSYDSINGKKPKLSYH